MKSHIFREYDIRGHADRDLESGLVRGIGRGLAELLAEARGGAGAAGPLRIAVGRDCRLSGPRLFEALSQGLVAGGAEVLDVGVGPTPLLYFAVHHLDADGGVMITGSHNPGADNGFKIMSGKASFFGSAIQRLRALVEGPALPALPGGRVHRAEIEDAYVSELANRVRIGGEPLKVVVDAGNGSAGPLGLRALRALGTDPIALFCDMDGTFPNHHPDPTVPENLYTLIERVKAESAHVGIAWDGDGDRLGVVDQSGEIVWGDRLLALFARPVLAERPGACIIGDVKCSQTLFDDIAKHGGRPIMWKTGHSLIKTKMKEEGAAIAGEMSGHFFFADRYFGYDDAIYAALRLLEILAEKGATVGELLADLPARRYTPELRVDCPDDLKFAVVEGLRAALSGEGEVNALDGLRITYPDGAWALVRASNTGPVLVLRFEAPSETRLLEIQSRVESVVERIKRNVTARGSAA
jgi:phosphomannomutase/phosphoglucomutase